jgi:GNAT superfamily N-acetyltransferase
MVFQIRSALIEDEPTLAAFNAAMASETEDRELNPGLVRQGVQAVFRRPELGRYFVAEEAGEIVGQLMLTYEWSDWRNGTFWWIQSVYVRADWRRHGVFRTLYRHVEQVARGTPGVCGLRLYVDQRNEQAMATYMDLGMSPSGHAVYEVDWVLGQRKE